MSSCLGCQEVSLLKVNKTFVCLNELICSANHLVPCGFKNVVLFFNHILSFFQTRPQGNICLTHRTEEEGKGKKNLCSVRTATRSCQCVCSISIYIYIYFFKNPPFSWSRHLERPPCHTSPRSILESQHHNTFPGALRGKVFLRRRRYSHSSWTSLPLSIMIASITSCGVVSPLQADFLLSRPSQTCTGGMR